MPKAERGSTKDVANRMRSKGLQRLRFYCQVCEKQMRDGNGFKQHTNSEPHVRAMIAVGQNPARKIHDYSRQFKSDFLQLLRTSHGEKRVNANHFYQEYISKKDHIHMNSTHWKTLTEFIKSLGREGICRVDITDKGVFVAWIDNSPEALARQEAIRRKDRLDKGDEERTNALLSEQVKRAQEEAARLKTDTSDGLETDMSSSL
ncbi:domain of Kin17 curved DNA-binding protein-domain-containing protein, partial [Protomyces lactucae-debilis]